MILRKCSKKHLTTIKGSPNEILQEKYSLEFFLGKESLQTLVTKTNLDLISFLKQNNNITEADIVVFLDNAPFERNLLNSLLKKIPVFVDLHLDVKNFLVGLNQTAGILQLRNEKSILIHAACFDKNSQFALLNQEIISRIISERLKNSDFEKKSVLDGFTLFATTTIKKIVLTKAQITSCTDKNHEAYVESHK